MTGGCRCIRIGIGKQIVARHNRRLTGSAFRPQTTIKTISGSAEHTSKKNRSASAVGRIYVPRGRFVKTRMSWSEMEPLNPGRRFGAFKIVGRKQSPRMNRRFRVQLAGDVKKNPTVMPCVTVPLNMTRNRWNPFDGIRRPMKACRQPAKARFRSFELTVQGLCFFTRTWQGLNPKNVLELAKINLRRLDKIIGRTAAKFKQNRF